LILGPAVLTLDRTVASPVKNALVLASAKKFFAILPAPFGC
jgi:hypothetical protein